MDFEDLKTGDLIHWVADRQFKAWNVIGRVIEVTKTEVKIISYDDFKVSKLDRAGEAIRDEISPASAPVADLWIRRRQLKIQDEILTRQSYIEELKSGLQRYDVVLDELKTDLYKTS